MAFFLVVFGLNAVFYISQTFRTPAGVHTVTGLFLFVAYLTSTVLIAMRKKIALWAVYATLALSFLVAVVNVLTGETSQSTGIVGTILISLVAHSLLALYFYVSKRVKATLTQN